MRVRDGTPVWSMALWHKPDEVEIKRTLQNARSLGAVVIGWNDTWQLERRMREAELRRWTSKASDGHTPARRLYLDVRPGDWIVARSGSRLFAAGRVRKPSPRFMREELRHGAIPLPSGLLYRFRGDLDRSGAYANAVYPVDWRLLTPERTLSGLPPRGHAILQVTQAASRVRALCRALFGMSGSRDLSMPAPRGARHAQATGGAGPGWGTELIGLESGEGESEHMRRAVSGRKVTRRERDLVIRFADYLLAVHGYTARRQKFRLPGARVHLYSDLFEQERGNLIEAKGSVDRGSIRMAIGQLADYAMLARRPEGDRVHRGLLLPERPGSDILRLLQSERIAAIWPTDGDRFRDSAGGRFT